MTREAIPRIEVYQSRANTTRPGDADTVELPIDASAGDLGAAIYGALRCAPGLHSCSLPHACRRADNLPRDISRRVIRAADADLTRSGRSDVSSSRYYFHRL